MGLKVVAVYAAEPPSVWPGYAYAVVADPVPPADMSAEVRAQVARAVRNAGVEGLVDVETRVLPGHPAQVLLDAADDAALIVVGRRGHSGFAAAIMGSTSRYVSAHASVPVVVVPHD
jgi:nucleotide-binding universal stress UspA family protein